MSSFCIERDARLEQFLDAGRACRHRPHSDEAGEDTGILFWFIQNLASSIQYRSESSYVMFTQPTRRF
jgi:hypothetical protein